MSLNIILDSVRRGGQGSRSSNSNETETISTSPLLETLIPGYGPLHKFLLAAFGFDISIFVTAFCVFWLGFKMVTYIYTVFYTTLMTNYTSSIIIGNYDDIFTHLMKWLADQPKMRSSRSLMAETSHKSAWDADGMEEELLADKYDESDDTWLNFSNQEAKAPPRFIPAFGTHFFRHNGTWFLLHRVQKTTMESGSYTYTDKEDLTLTCLGRSPNPIKRLLQDAKDHYLLDNTAKTVIRRPSSKEMRRFGARHCWTQVAHRPCRPMATVVLDKARKQEVLHDINEYLHPATPRWYANRGIPYRRGYLFHGVPGSGKTSLSFALAGVFGLDIYVISLLEPSITEEDLGQLFSTLPRRCVVLLEDIDSAGLLRVEDEKGDAKQEQDSKAKNEKKGGGKVDDQMTIRDLAKALKKANAESEEEKKKGISLSGLLNAIDGVASHEGRVLIMTTNKPEKLDAALIRPGRVDLQVAFGNATKMQIEELFVRMYTSDTKNSKVEVGRKAFVVNDLTAEAVSIASSLKKSARTTVTDLTPPITPTKILEQGEVVDMDANAKKEVEETLDEIAASFASKIPDGEFSPAEIQGFLLKRKKNPKKANAEVGRWVEAMLESKKDGGKVLDVQ